MVLAMERQSFAGGRPCEYMQIQSVPERYEFRMQVEGQLELARGIHHVAATLRGTSRSER